MGVLTSEGILRENRPHKIPHVTDYEKYVGPETIERILNKAKTLHDLRVVHVNSTYYGGGVAELLSSISLLMNGVGIKTEWRKETVWIA